MPERAPPEPTRQREDLSSSASDLARADAARLSRVQVLLEIALIFALFLLHAGLTVPDVNEPYYLAKAKHYWNPDWCRGDLFLESADSHAAFYWTCGWWTLWLSLPATAIVGRLLTYGLLAWSWRRLSAALVPGPWWSVLSAALMVAFSARLHMAGEWIVGGFEAKGLAYVAVFLALEAVALNRWNRAWVLLGLATLLHVLVGGWSLLAAGVAWLFSGRDADRPSIRAMLPGLIVGCLIATPSVLSALKLDRGADAAAIDRAAQTQVFSRLPHHLNPGKFFIQDGMPTDYGWRFMSLALLWLCLCRLQRRTEGRVRFARFIQAALLFAALGILIYGVAFGLAESPRVTAAALKFYWFRLADAIVPVGAALAVVGFLEEALRRDRVPGATPQPSVVQTSGALPQAPLGRRSWRRNLAWAGLAAALMLAVAHLGLQTYDRWQNPIPLADRRHTPTDALYADWLAICRVAAEQQPASAVFLTPRGAQTFKWYAGRAESAVLKEMPQDAASIDRWWSRMTAADGLLTPGQTLADLTTDQIRALGRARQAKYLVTRYDPRIALFCVARKNSFALYRLEP
ncbi:MAG: hypothetical protein K8T25_22820 [Planctomycetia bacterium]|nr:hypothetical protein [Planctomycetia bacterium]